MSSFLGWPNVQGEETGTGEGLMLCPRLGDCREARNRAKEHEGWAHSYLQKGVPCPKHFPTSHMGSGMPHMAFVGTQK